MHKCRGKGGKAGPPVHDDLIQRSVIPDGSSWLWLADITEHHTAEGKLHPLRDQGVWSHRIVRYCIDSRTKSRLAVAALGNAAASGDLAGRILHTDRGSNSDPEHSSEPSTATTWRSMGRVGVRRRQRHHGILLRPLAEQHPEPTIVGHSPAATDRDRALDRARPTTAEDASGHCPG